MPMNLQKNNSTTNYDNEFVYVNDPLQDEKNIPLNRGDFEAAWVQMNKQAMYITS